MKKPKPPVQYTTMIPEGKIAVTHNNKIYLIPKDTFEMFCLKSQRMLENAMEEYVVLMKISPVEIIYDKPNLEVVYPS